MVAVDTNVLVYAHRSELPLHRPARERLTALAEGAALWGLPVFCIGEFVRIVTHARVLTPPSTLEEATAALTGLMTSPSLATLSPGERYWPLLQEALREGRASGNVAFDAQIVAVCREHGVSRLLTEDRDFHRFHGFQVEHLA